MRFYGEEFTVDRIKAAYASTGKFPVNLTFLNPEGGCCALSAAMLASDVVTEDELSAMNMEAFLPMCARLADLSGATAEEIRSFIAGFDGDMHIKEFDTTAYMLGKVVADELL